MEDGRIDAAFQALHSNMPRAPEAMVEKMVRTVRALETERVRRAGIQSPAVSKQADRQAQRELKPRTPKLPGI